MDDARLTSTARQVADHPVVETGARVGYAVNGMLHLVIAWLGLQLVLGHSSGNADQGGALAKLASNPVGKATLWVTVAALALLAVWQVAEALRASEWSDRAKSIAKGILYLVLAFTAWKFVSGSGESSKGQTVDVTRTLMSAPAGRFLVGAVGLAIIGVGAYHVVKGVRQKFLDDLREHPGRWAVVAGQIGYVAKGLALGVVGSLFVLAAVRANPNESTGLDGALRKLLGLPFGQALCVAVALGFAAFAVYYAARARYAKV